MIFMRPILLLFILNIDCLRAIKTGALMIGNNAEIRKEDLLSEFMTDLRKFSSKILKTHRIMILGKKGNMLQATKSVLQSGTPYFIGTETASVKLPPAVGVDRVVLFLIDGCTDSEINSTFAWLPDTFQCRTLIISMEENVSDQMIATTILSAVEMKLRNIVFARFDGELFKIYGRILHADCKQKITILNKWVPTKGFEKNGSVLGHNLLVNEHGCRMSVSTFEILPTMILREDENKSLHINGGTEGRLVQTIAEYLNIVPIVKVPSMKDVSWTLPNGTDAGIIGAVAREEAVFGIGQIRPTLKRLEKVDFTRSYNHECEVWTVPLITKYNNSVLFSEFSPTTWAIVVLSVSLCFGLAYVIPRLNIGHRTSLTILDVIALTLNYSVPRPPKSLLCKLLFILYLHYCRIISTAYSSSLSSILTTATPQPTIVDADGILAAGLRTAGSYSRLSMLVDMHIPQNDKKIELINRYEVIMSLEAALARVADRQDIAYLRQHSTMSYVRKELAMGGKPIKFVTIPECVMAYSSVIVTPKGSRLTGEVNNIITRLVEAGLDNHWFNQDRVYQAKIKSWIPNSDSFARLRSIFVLYLCCLIPAFLAFAAELIIFKLKIKWFTR